jgi:hypothetical protein
VAAVVVRVVDERHAGALAQRQQVGRGEQPVVVLEGEARAGAVGERVERALEPLDGGVDAARRAAHVQGERVRAHQLGDQRLELDLAHRRLAHRLALGVEHDELVGVEAEPHVERAASGRTRANASASGSTAASRAASPSSAASV